MASSTERTRRQRAARALVAPVLLVALAGLFVVAGRVDGRPEQAVGAGYSKPDDLTFDEEVEATAATDALAARRADDLQTSKEAVDSVGDRRKPFLFRTSDQGTQVLVVPGQGKVHHLDEVAAAVPEAFERTYDGGLLLLVPLVVAPGAELVVDSARIPDLLLRSEPSGYASIQAVQATLTFRGHEGKPIVVNSYDTAAGTLDGALDDGRAYVLAREGRMDLTHADLSALGFPSDSGATSGVAWTASDGRTVTGSAHDTTFHHNYFGAYTANAVGLQVVASEFLDNDVYGFDPHTATTDTLVDRSVAARNGRHGFIFSEGCLRNVVRDSEAYLNGGDGFVIDDGAVGHGQGRPSDANQLIGVSAHDNGAVGIVIEGGADNRVEEASVVNNRDGVWVRNQATGTVLRGLDVTATARSGVRLGEDLGSTQVEDVRVTGAAFGLWAEGGSATTFDRVAVADTTDTAVLLEGGQSEATFRDVTAVTSEGRGLDVAGGSVLDSMRSGISADGGTHGESWALGAVLHPSIIGLWVLILAVPLVAMACSSTFGRRPRLSPVCVGGVPGGRSVVGRR